MAIPREKMKSLTEMTVPELKDLILRQEKLINNKNFVNHLPDRGAKIWSSIEQAREALSSLNTTDHTADLFSKMALNAESSRMSQEDNDDCSDILGAIVNLPERKVFIDERDELDLHLQESYLRVIKDNPEKMACSTERFRPNSLNRRNRPTRSTEELTSPPQRTRDTLQEDVMDLTGCASPRKLKFRYDDLLEEGMRTGPSVHESAKMISLQESVALMYDQKKKQEEYQNVQAMERLAQQLRIKIPAFDPEGSRYMAYRQQDNFDSDDEDAEKDYGDEPTQPSKRAQ